MGYEREKAERILVSGKEVGRKEVSLSYRIKVERVKEEER